MAQTKKNIQDSIRNILTRFKVTDETRLAERWLSYKIDQVRAQLIVAQYLQTGIIDQSWLTDLGLLTCYKVNRADNNTISCECDISKTTIPQVVSLVSNQGNQDLGLYSVMSGCGKYNYSMQPISRWRSIPPEHTYSLFTFYFRINTDLYLSKVMSKVRAIAILLHPEDGYLNNSAPVASGSLVNGTVYLVKYSQIVYNSTVYAANSTFTATATTTFTGQGTVYLNSQVEAYDETDPYPASGEMIRAIELEILTKEFGIEAGQIADIRNDSIDDTQKQR